MRSILLACAITLFTFSFSPVTASAETVIKGAGASFPYPLYRWWSLRYGKTSDTRIDYESIGSGGGIKKIQAKEVDFGATDAPLSADELNKHGLIQFATVLGGVVPVINVPGVAKGELKLSGALLADIFMGKVSNWNHDSIKKLNPDQQLPNLAIKVVHRSESSGTTWIFTNYLSKVSPAFKSTVGNAKKVTWPVGVSVNGNEGIVKEVHGTPGTIGYAGYDFAVQSETNYTMLENRSGKFVHPNHDSFQDAAASVDWSRKNADIILTDKDGENAWPIVGATFILMHKTQTSTAKAKELLSFLNWCYSKDGDFPAEMIDYVPVPDELVATIQNEWTTIKGSDGKAAWPL